MSKIGKLIKLPTPQEFDDVVDRYSSRTVFAVAGTVGKVLYRAAFPPGTSPGEQVRQLDRMVATL